MNQWCKAKHSKYRHFYVDGKAICGSKAKAYPSSHTYKHAFCGKYCRKCQSLKPQTVMEGEQRQ